MIKIIIVLIVLIVLVLICGYFWPDTFNKENFKLNLDTSSSSKISDLKSNPKPTSNYLPNGSSSLNAKSINNIQYSLGNMTTKQNNLKQNILSRQSNKNKTNSEQDVEIIEKRVLFDNKDYNENLSIDNKDNKYYYTDMINQSDINETAFNVVYSIDPIDYSDVKTGIDKCNESCGGVCFENGYDGIATCYPKENQPFDWGTLYKNPTFTYGYNAYGPQNLPQ